MYMKYSYQKIFDKKWSVDDHMADPVYIHGVLKKVPPLNSMILKNSFKGLFFPGFYFALIE